MRNNLVCESDYSVDGIDPEARWFAAEEDFMSVVPMTWCGRRCGAALRQLFINPIPARFDEAGGFGKVAATRNSATQLVVGDDA